MTNNNNNEATIAVSCDIATDCKVNIIEWEDGKDHEDGSVRKIEMSFVLEPNPDGRSMGETEAIISFNHTQDFENFVECFFTQTKSTILSMITDIDEDHFIQGVDQDYIWNLVYAEAKQVVVYAVDKTGQLKKAFKIKNADTIEKLKLQLNEAVSRTKLNLF